MQPEVSFRGGAEARRARPWTGVRLAAVALLPLFVLACSFKSETERLADAKKLLDDRNVVGAIIAYQDFLKKFPQSEKLIEAKFGLATCYFIEQDYEKCRGVLDSIILASGGAATRNGMNAELLKFQTYQRERKFDVALTEAEKTSDSLKSAAPELKQFFELSLGQLYELNEKPDQASLIYEAMLKDNPASQQAHVNHLEAIIRQVTLYMRRKEPDKAFAVYKSYLELHPKSDLDARIHTDWGRLLQREDRKEEALEHFTLAKNLMEEQEQKAASADEKSYYMLAIADVEELRGKKEDARNIYRKVIDDYPLGRNRPHAMMQLAESLFRDGDIESALGTLDQVVQNYPKTQQAGQAFKRAQEMRAVRTGAGKTSDTLTQAAMQLNRDAPTSKTQAAPEKK